MINLTAITKPEEFAIKHIIDSLMVLEACGPRRQNCDRCRDRRRDARVDLGVRVR